jgi:hypothetical protein
MSVGKYISTIRCVPAAAWVRQFRHRLQDALTGRLNNNCCSESAVGGRPMIMLSMVLGSLFAADRMH